MTSLALVSVFSTAVQVFLVCTVFAYGTLAFVVVGKALREDREAAEQDAELERLCQEGQHLQARRNSGRIMRGNCHVPAEERWSA